MISQRICITGEEVFGDINVQVVRRYPGAPYRYDIDPVVLDENQQLPQITRMGDLKMTDRKRGRERV